MLILNIPLPQSNHWCWWPAANGYVRKWVSWTPQNGDFVEGTWRYPAFRPSQKVYYVVTLAVRRERFGAFGVSIFPRNIPYETCWASWSYLEFFQASNRWRCKSPVSSESLRPEGAYGRPAGGVPQWGNPLVVLMDESANTTVIWLVVPGTFCWMGISWSQLTKQNFAGSEM